MACRVDSHSTGTSTSVLSGFRGTRARRASRTSVLLKTPGAARALSLTLSLFLATRRLAMDTSYVPVPRTKKQKLQSIPESIECLNHPAEVTPRRKTTQVHVFAALKHLDLMDAGLSDRTALRVSPSPETVKLLDVIHKGKLSLPSLVVHHIPTYSISLYDLALSKTELVLDLNAREVESIDVFIGKFGVKDDLRPLPLLCHPNAEGLKLRIDCPPYKVVYEIRVLRRIRNTPRVSCREVQDLKSSFFHQFNGRVSIPSTSCQ